MGIIPNRRPARKIATRQDRRINPVGRYAYTMSRIHAALPMNDDRRYTEEEIEAIFRVAAESQEAARTARRPGEGLTISELQEIGLDAGITPEFIAHAAATFDRALPVEDRQRPRSYLGLPTGVRHVVELPAELDDADWDEIVALCRDTFEARGRIERDGSSHQWRNGNLHVMLERTARGQRLRMGSRRDMGRNAINGALGAAAFTVFLIAMLAAQGRLPEMRSLVLIVAFGLVSMGMGAWTAITTPQWARDRERQMQMIADRALELSRAKEGDRSTVRDSSAVGSGNAGDMVGPATAEKNAGRIELDEEPPPDSGLTDGRQAGRDRA